jgi:hypothetical protein
MISKIAIATTKKNNPIQVINVLKSELDRILSSTRSRKSQIDIAKKKLIDSLNSYIINSIHDSISTYIKNYEQILNAFSSNRSLSLTQRNTVQQISKVVANGILFHMGGYSDGLTISGHKLLDSQNRILVDIANFNRIGLADSNLLAAFKDYAGDKLLDNNDKIRNKLKSPYRTINNAATDSLSSLGISGIICPNSSIVDAMGSFGSCSSVTTSSQLYENYNMDFILSNEQDNDFYAGQSIMNKRTLLINYTANINNFNLPYVEKKIDMSNMSSIKVFSANNTFRLVINKILQIWQINFGEGSRLPQGESFWEIIFENKTFFLDLVSVGSLKSVGDFYQEINSVAEQGGYMESDPIDTFNKKVVNKYTVGAMGDQPSGVRAGFMLLKAVSGTNPKSIAGYFGPPSDRYETDFAVISKF